MLSGADAAAARAALSAADLPPDRRLGVVFALAVTAPAACVAAAACASLAAAALAAFPRWYGSDGLAGNGGSHLEAALLDGHLRTLQAQMPELSLLWARRAVARARAGKAPGKAGLPSAAMLRQIALALNGGALNGGALTLIPVLPEQTPDAAEAAATVRALEWLARTSGAAVVALLPGRADTDRFDRLDGAELADDTPPPGAPADTIPDIPWAGPIEGRPHWASAAEQRMAAALAADRDLATLFAFNQPVATRRGSRPRVDLLWQAGRLVVEIDGYADHASRTAFRRDRQRDYELAISGYLVLRLTAEEVLADPQLALDKLRDAVRFRSPNGNPESA